MPEVQIYHYGTVKNGRIIYDRPVFYQAELQKLDGKDVKVVIEERKEKKTIPQLAFYFGGIIRKTCLESTLFEGWMDEEIDQFFRHRFLSYIKTMRYPDNTSAAVKVINELRDLSKDEMTMFISHVIRFLNENGIEVLEPEMYKYNKYLQEQNLNIGDNW
jgi:hypothetical protein